MVSTAHEAMSAMCPASCPRDIDLGCGFQSHFPSGTAANNLRVFSISASNSGSNLSLIVIDSAIVSRSPTLVNQGSDAFAVDALYSLQSLLGERRKIRS